MACESVACDYVTMADLCEADWDGLGSVPAELCFGPGSGTHTGGGQERIKEICGSPFIYRQSYLFQPHINESIVNDALALVPHEVQSKQGHTKTSLIESISASRFFDKQNALKGGGRTTTKRKSPNF